MELIVLPRIPSPHPISMNLPTDVRVFSYHTRHDVDLFKSERYGGASFVEKMLGDCWFIPIASQVCHLDYSTFRLTELKQ